MTALNLERIRERMPPKDVLIEGAPYELWLEAVKQAARSPHKRHRTGAIIFDRFGRILSRGCAHPTDFSYGLRSLHAERHALQNWKGEPGPFEIYCLVVTLTAKDRFASVSKPCADCRRALTGRVNQVIYVERANDGSWVLCQSSPEEIKRPCIPSYL